VAGRVWYLFLNLGQDDKFLNACGVVHGVSFAIIDMQTPWPKFELFSSGETRPILICWE